jgi:glyoxylase-like metal-dependent hydrolase (beta-lactamase superfamily II)/rhodanese-related sulfurtransferase
MIFQQYYLACLSHASYLVGDQATGRAIVVDPQRDVSAYLADAAAHGLRIERIVETHFHADFLSGHLELAAQTGAQICYGAPAQADFPITTLNDGEAIDLGEVRIVAWATPGHTPESISLVVYEHADDAVPYGVLTGDTLFIGDVGRPDLIAAADGLSPQDMARSLYHSLHHRLLSLPDATRVFPAHGAGSACGRSLSTETQSTIGVQRRSNYALQPMSEAAFVDLVTEGQPPAPPYFAFDAQRNRQAHALFDEDAALVALDLDAVLRLQRAGGVVLDTRAPNDYAAGHLRGSLNVGLEGRFAEYAGDVISPQQRVAVVAEDGREAEAVLRLARVGFDDVVGFLHAPLRAFLDHPELTERSSRLSADDLAQRLAGGVPLTVLDVRSPGEVAGGSIPGAVAIPLPRLLERLGEVDLARPLVVCCQGGYRSSIAAAVLRRAGAHDVSDLLGGYEAWTLRRDHLAAAEP